MKCENKTVTVGAFSVHLTRMRSATRQERSAIVASATRVRALAAAEREHSVYLRHQRAHEVAEGELGLGRPVRADA
jgi:hypothetical protein